MYLRKMTALIMLFCLSCVAGCLMQSSVEVSGGFLDSELQAEY